ncbi:dihydrofolate reductase [Brevibacillus gelatini]|uniref:Dihydrofolate reductase n=1 Tax=Brevibacillus gelatini TaxID=1655277 RepID=A0A3M8B7G4_9BACL|nr:dihydrofolate reductase [Brevibacillus gelatini]RNB59368.1 dihydrofolate reductase [Brevibacillus gelatini]
MISIITAFDRNRLIGNNNSLPWKLPRDLAYFKEKTLGKVVVQGRKTFESLKKPLFDRTNVILTSRPDFHVEGCYVSHSVKDILERYRNEDEVFVIGGASVYKQFLPHTSRIYITFVDAEFEGDTYFPVFDMNDWELVSMKKGIKDEQNKHDHTFFVYEIKNKNNKTYLQTSK